MLNKKIVFIIIVLFSLLAISAVSANDNSTGEGPVDIALDDGADNLDASFENEELSAGSGNFTDLNNLINGSGSEVYLEGNYTFDIACDSNFTEGINVDHEVTIYGNGHTIDANSSARIFAVSASGVVFRNITFINANTMGNGGAVYGKCTAINCTFINNHADLGGGAMREGTAINCTFKENSADWGGAICEGSCENCIFKDNHATTGGGAIHSTSAVFCNFTGNVADRYGGAMEYSSAVNCIFRFNRALFGGAIEEGSAINCTFENNHADDGGAIHDPDDSIINCTFTSNDANGWGGAIMNGVAIGCNFTDNRAVSGGAAHSGSCMGCIFTENHASYDGGAMHSANAVNCTFTDNHAENDGGATYLSDVSDCNFTNNRAGNYGGAMYGRELDVIGCLFINNSAVENGGAVYVENTLSNSRINSTFINNTAYNAGAIYFGGDIWNVTINGYFEGNVANRTAGAIHVHGQSQNSTFKADFYNNSAMEASGGAIFFYAPVENSIFGSVFIGNYALYGGGIFFYSTANCNRFASDFTFNVAKSCGGAMFFYATTNANNFTGSFINNSALGKVDVVNGNGGAITFKNNSTNCIFTCDFINNTASKNGGALNYRQGSCNITFNGNFIGNHANNGGGINFFEGFESVTFNANFTANSAILGGAIASKNGVVENVSFLNNHADMGGAAYFSDGGTVVNCSFTNNSAANYGGAVYLGGNGTIYKSAFKSNNASDGGAILSYGDLMVKNSIFEGNSAVFKTDNVGLKGNAVISLSNNTPEDLGPLCGGYLTVLNVSNVIYGETVRIAVSVVDENHIPFDRGTVSVVIGGRTYSSNVEGGNATIEIPNLNAGNYDVNVTYGERNLDSSAKFKVSRQNAVIIAGNKAYIINYGGKYSVTLKDANGKVISGKKVLFKFNGKNIASAITNAKGIATLSLTAKILKAAKAGKKNLVIQFDDSNYNSASKTVKITVNKERTKLIAKNKKFKRFKKVKRYTVALKNSKGKALKKVWVTLKVKGKTYKVKTNSNGKATFKIKKLTKKGKYKATVTYKGNNYYNKVTKKVKIIIK